MMNKKSYELNLSDTHYVTPHGLDSDEHFTTALDLARLTDYALNNETFAKIVKTKTYTILINNQPKSISNTNELLGNFEGIYGVKTGFTNGANRCLVTSCKRDNLDYICIVLGCDTKKDRTRDSIKLLDYSFKNFSVVDFKKIATSRFDEWNESHNNSFFINKGKSQNLNLYLDESDFPFENIALKNSEKDSIDIEIDFNFSFEAPICEKTKIGNLHLYVNEKKYYSIDIFNKNEITRKSIIDYILHILMNYCSFFDTL
ncbi:MAG: hypothetical protein IJK18_05675 [Clostridia bacterium]|nr:hypothetical protein [Clostridia bacterium]